MTNKLQTALTVLVIFAAGLLGGLALGGSGTRTVTEPAQTVTQTVTRPAIHHAQHKHATTQAKGSEPSLPEPSAAEQAVESNPELVEGSEK